MSINLSENPEYGFAVGRIRSLETQLLDRNRYERLLHSPGQDGFAAVLADTAYGRFLPGDGAVDLARPLAAAASENFAFFREYCIDRWLLDIFRLRADIHNLKTVVKSRLAGMAAAPGGMLGFGRLGVGELQAVDAGTAGPTLAVYSEAVRRATAGYAANGDPACIDLVLDGLAQEIALDLARPSDFVSGYLYLHADLENLRTLVRVKLLPADQKGRGAAVYAEALLAGGTLATGFLQSLLPENLEAIAGRFGSSVYRQYVEEGAAAAVRAKSLLRMERLGRELELRHLRASRFATFGHEPLVAFYLARENELRNLRLLYAAKQSGTPDEDARELVAYVD